MDNKNKSRGPVRLSDISKVKSKPNNSYDKKTAVPKNLNHNFDAVDKFEDSITKNNSESKSKKKTYEKRKQYKTKEYGIDINADLTQSSEENSDPHLPKIWQGKISSIEVQKRNKERFNIYINGEFSFGVSDSTLIRFALHKEQELTPDNVNDIYQSERQSSAYNIAIRYLSHRLRSEKEVRDKLAEEEVPIELIVTTIEKLKDINLVNDIIYGQSYTRTTALINRKGPSTISHELKRKGLSEGDIAVSLDEYNQADQLENAKLLGEKQYLKQSRRHSMRESEQKTKSFLIQKGYDSEIVQQVIEELRNDMQDDEQEEAALKNQLDKYWRKYQKLSISDRVWKVKSMMFGKGYDNDAISHLLDDLAADEEEYENY